MSLYHKDMNLIGIAFYRLKYFQGSKIVTKKCMSVLSLSVLLLSVSLLTTTNLANAQNASLSTEDGLGGSFNFANPIIDKCYDIAVSSQNMTNFDPDEQNKTSSFLGFCDDGIKKVRDICDQSFNLLAICTNQNIEGYLDLRPSNQSAQSTAVDPCPPGWKMGTSGKCEQLSTNNSVAPTPTTPEPPTEQPGLPPPEAAGDSTTMNEEKTRIMV